MKTQKGKLKQEERETQGGKGGLSKERANGVRAFVGIVVRGNGGSGSGVVIVLGSGDSDAGSVAEVMVCW